MAIAEFLKSILVCPVTKQSLQEIEGEKLQQLQAAFASGTLCKVEGRAANEAFEGALRREDGKVFYPIRQGIPCLLESEGILMPPV